MELKVAVPSSSANEELNDASVSSEDEEIVDPLSSAREELSHCRQQFLVAANALARCERLLEAMDSMDLNSELLGECPEIANSKLENDKLKYRICILKQVCNVFTVMAETLKKNGSVLMPMCPTGVLYDLLEVITVQLDQQGVAMDTPVYFISPVAESSIAFSNICPEWLSDKKQNMAYFPEEPFTHAYVFESLHGALCHQLKSPCILFTGHPSLRFGEAVRFLELWGNNPRNAVIITDPDYPLKDVYGPYQNLAIRAFFYPIDTRLDYSQLNPSIMPDL